jgi:hypothetical protein
MNTEKLTYTYSPRLMGSVYEFQLSQDGMDWSLGPRGGRISYPMIKRIRLGYKPTSMASARFIAEIWPINAPKLLVSSVSARSMTHTEDQGRDYSNFIRELHRRVAAAKADCSYETGFPAWRWWPSVFIGLITFGAVAYILLQGILARQYALAGVIGLIGGWFAWQIWNVVKRNRPRRYMPDAIPDDVLPA